MSFDTSKLENSGWRLFLKEIQEWYHFEYPELSNEWKDQTIEYVIVNNAKLFNRYDVLRENLCDCCGRCCQEIGCVDWDPDTKLCTKHTNQNSKICSDFPWDDDVGMVFTLNCGYQRKYVIKYLNKLFDKAVEMGVK